MVQVDDDVLAEARRRGQNLIVTDLVWLVERAHDSSERGVSRERLDAYLEALDASLDADALAEAIEERVTDSESWEGESALYEVVGDRVSRYPADWHDDLGPDADVVDFVRVLNDRLDDPPYSGANDAVSEDFLVHAVAVLGDADPDAARSRLEDLRTDGVVEEYPDQHPDAGVRVADAESR